MKNTEIRQLSTVDLVEKLREERALLQKMQFSHAVSPVENPMKLKASRKLIARYLTELSKRNKEQQAQ
ncbi:MAG: 50S ribosomal protein L29 [Bacteroidota bacterium]|jgi:large subunit ribosomal protein L29|nr:MAG: 50S ribosomal protein L29 [Bacteroidota bacterium]